MRIFAAVILVLVFACGTVAVRWGVAVLALGLAAIKFTPKTALVRSRAGNSQRR